MSGESKGRPGASISQEPTAADRACEAAPGGSCSVCGDEALPGRVLAVNEFASTALVRMSDSEVEVSLDLVEAIAVGDVLMVHQGFAIGTLEREGARGPRP